MVCSSPSPFMMVNDEAVSAKIGPSTVPPCTSTAVIPPMLKKPPAVSRLQHPVVLGERKSVEGILSNAGVHRHLIRAGAHDHSLVANVQLIARHVHDVSGRCLGRIAPVVVGNQRWLGMTLPRRADGGESSSFARASASTSSLARGRFLGV